MLKAESLAIDRTWSVRATVDWLKIFVASFPSSFCRAAPQGTVAQAPHYVVVLQQLQISHFPPAIMSLASQSHIALPYRILFLYIEPLAALFGTYTTLFHPEPYLLSLSPTATYSSLTYPVYAQIAGHDLLFSWLQAVLLRSTSSVRIWKIVLFGILMCDVLHLYGSYVVLGPESFFDPRTWRWEEWITFVMTYGPGLLRAAFCLEIGVSQTRATKRS